MKKVFFPFFVTPVKEIKVLKSLFVIIAVAVLTGCNADTKNPTNSITVGTAQGGEGGNGVATAQEQHQAANATVLATTGVVGGRNSNVFVADTVEDNRNTSTTKGGVKNYSPAGGEVTNLPEVSNSTKNNANVSSSSGEASNSTGAGNTYNTANVSSSSVADSGNITVRDRESGERELLEGRLSIQLELLAQTLKTLGQYNALNGDPQIGVSQLKRAGSVLIESRYLDGKRVRRACYAISSVAGNFGNTSISCFTNMGDCNEAYNLEMQLPLEKNSLTSACKQ